MNWCVCVCVDVWMCEYVVVWLCAGAACECLRERDDVFRMVREFAEDACAAGCVWSEVSAITSPTAATRLATAPLLFTTHVHHDISFDTDGAHTHTCCD